MNLDELDVLANRAFTYINEDQPEKAVDVLISASTMAFDFAETSTDPEKRADLVTIGNDYIVLAEDILNSLKELQPDRLSTENQLRNESERDWSYKIPSITFDDVVGMDTLKKEITTKVIKPNIDPKLRSLASQYKLPQKYNILLYGPTGTGKTFFASAIAGELGWPLFVISGSAIKSKFVGESEKNLAQLFSQAKSHNHSVVFIDEIETLFPNRKTKDLQHHEKILVGEFLTLLDGIDPIENWMLIIGATNNPTELDEALLRDGRLGIHAFIGLPEKELIVEMIKKEVGDISIIGEISYEDIAEKLLGLTLNSIKHIVIEARSIAYMRDEDYYNQHPEMERVARGIKEEDFDQAITIRNPMRISEESLAEMRAFQEKHLNNFKE